MVRRGHIASAEARTYNGAWAEPLVWGSAGASPPALKP